METPLEPHQGGLVVPGQLSFSSALDDPAWVTTDTVEFVSELMRAMGLDG